MLVNEKMNMKVQRSHGVESAQPGRVGEKRDTPHRQMYDRERVFGNGMICGLHIWGVYFHKLILFYG